MFSFSIDRDLILNADETHTNVVTVVAEDDEGDTASLEVEPGNPQQLSLFEWVNGEAIPC
ncbi:MAG: hypothetical protein QNJ33_00280 [Crocosphaera sp.]|nr:hypothetical protein [Crocosphaera sp.]